MKNNTYSGKFIVLEGLDGSGQTTQAGLLYEALIGEGYQAILTKEPTPDTEAGQRVRRILQKKESRIDALELQKLFAEDRKIHLEKCIIPALKEGKIVIIDRYYFSSLAFGAADGASMSTIGELNQEFLLPDIIFFLDVPAEECLRRIEGRSQKELFEELENLKKVHGYLARLTENYPRYSMADAYTIDGRADREVIAGRIFKKTLKLLIKRPSKVESYLGSAREAARRAVCYRRFSGAVIVVNDAMVSTGYTGAPRGALDCFERGSCLRDEQKIPAGQRYEICRSVHAEQNAIINAGRAGVSLLGGDMYIVASTRTDQPINAFPCFICKKMIINAGIVRVICRRDDGSVRVYDVADWVGAWRSSSTDMLDDPEQYGK